MYEISTHLDYTGKKLIFFHTLLNNNRGLYTILLTLHVQTKKHTPSLTHAHRIYESSHVFYLCIYLTTCSKDLFSKHVCHCNSVLNIKTVCMQGLLCIRTCKKLNSERIYSFTFFFFPQT